MNSAATVRLAGVTRRFKSATALAGVDLDLRPGICGLLGPNGAGKTTLLRILATVIAPDRGTVEVLGHDPATPAGRLAIRRSLGYLPQEPGFHERFTAFEFVDYVAILKEHTDRRARHDEVRRVLELVDLGPVAHKRIRQLSGGMRQRVALAQSLLGDPALLVLDEPTVGLDPEQRLRFRRLVSDLAEHRTVLLSTHLTEDIEALCDRVAVMDHGRVTFDGTPADLAGVARGRVWLGDRSDGDALVAWRTADGRHRNVGMPPPDADLLDPSVEDGYLLLMSDGQAREVGVR